MAAIRPENQVITGIVTALGTLIPPPAVTRSGRKTGALSGDPFYIPGSTQVPGLVRELHRSLDVGDVIMTFLAACEGVIPHDSYSYENPDRGLALTGGAPARYSTNWPIETDGEALGSLTLTRATRFTQHEMRGIEALLTLLGLPLRNALRYQAALALSQHDVLTGLMNRAGFEATLARELKLARRNQTPLSLVFMDIDHFKAINDTHGHAAGDQVLRAVGEVIARCMRATDMLARVGGEEFVAIQPGADDTGAQRLGERVIKAMRNAEVIVRRKRIPMTISVGVATFDGREDEKRLLHRADQAMYRAKHEGRDRLCIAP